MVQVSLDALKEQFSTLGVNLTEPVLKKCVEICETNCIDEEEFVETWMAYTVSNLGGADPTVETLVQMERNCLTKTEQETNTSSKKQKKTSSLVIYNASTIDSFLDAEDTTNDDICKLYDISHEPLTDFTLGPSKYIDTYGPC